MERTVYSMALVGVNCPRGYIPLEQHYECMLDPAHPCPFTPDILNAMTEPNVERRESDVKYSPSTMMGCRRQRILSRDKDWFLNVNNAWVMQRGHMAHAYAETLKPWQGTLGIVREVRLKAPINTSRGVQWFAGKMDAVTLNRVEIDLEVGAILHVSIIDYKSKAEIGHGPDTHETDSRILPGHAAAHRDNQQQVNLYAWLVRNSLADWLNTHRGDEKILLTEGSFLPDIDVVIVDELVIEYLDFSKARRFSSLTPLTSRGKRNPDRKTYEELVLDPIFVSSQDYLTRWIVRHIELEWDAEENLPPPITGDDAQKFCYRCPVRNICYEVGRQEGYEMNEQAPY